MDTLVADVRFAVRSLRRRPAFAGIIVVTVAIAIGATTVMMSVVNAAIVRPLPFRDANQLVYGQGFVKREQAVRGLSFLEAGDWRARNRSFESLATYNQISLNIGDAGGDPRRVDAEIVSSEYFHVLGAGAARGRTFLAEEDRTPNANAVAVISHGLWQTQFGGAESVVGRTMIVNGTTFTIVGVMPPDFSGVSFQSDVWIPMMMVSTIRPVSTLENRTSRWLSVVGRRKAGVSLDDARRDFDRVTKELEAEYRETNTDRGAQLTSLRAFYLGTTQTLLLTLFGAVGFLLLIACANVMSLQLVRAAGRRREMALRVALGAGRERMLRQLVTEGLALALVGATVGVVLAMWGVDILPSLLPAGLLPSYANVRLDASVLAATAAIAIVVGVVFGLAPMLSRSRDDLVTSLKDGAPSTAAGLGSMRRVRAQQILVVGEIALALVLVVGASLMVRSLGRQLNVAPGFRADGITAARVSLPLDRYDGDARTRFAEQLTQRIRAFPGVTAVAFAADLPLRGLQSSGYLTFDGSPREGVHYARHRVSPDFFTTLGIPVLRGRTFTSTDRREGQQVAVISASMARRYWGERTPVGQTLNLAGTDAPILVQIVGVVADVRFRDLVTNLQGELATVDVYFPFAQSTDETLEIAVRGDIDQRTLAAQLRAAMRTLDPTLPLFNIATLSSAVVGQTSAPRFASLMLSVFAAIAIILAAVGIYGLLAFVVGSSSRDIAIRMALGAASASVVALVIRKGMTLATAGIALGIALCIPSTRMLASFLFDIRASDPATIAGVTTGLALVALLACWLPARRVSRVDPQTVLRSE
jgi:predicted permease